MARRIYTFGSDKQDGLFIVLATLAIIIGTSIYLFLRTSELVIFKWMEAIGFDDLLRSPSLFQRLALPEWLVYSIPNGLWAFAYAVIITGIWNKSNSWLKYLWFCSVPVLVLGYELLQYSGSIRGTFCIQDLVLGLAGLILGFLVGHKLSKNRNHEKAF